MDKNRSKNQNKKKANLGLALEMWYLELGLGFCSTAITGGSIEVVKKKWKVKEENWNSIKREEIKFKSLKTEIRLKGKKLNSKFKK